MLKNAIFSPKKIAWRVSLEHQTPLGRYSIGTLRERETEGDQETPDAVTLSLMFKR